MEEKVLIEFKNVNKKYGKKVALNNVNFSVSSGRIVGLLGPNGAGKTTIIKLINGLLKDYTGEILIDGEKHGVKSKGIISYLPDVDYFQSWMKIKDTLSIFEDLYEDFDVEKAMNLMYKMNLSPNMRVKELSKGMKEKMRLILVMSRNAKIYILDEPIGGVDPASREVVLDTILNNYSPESLVLFSTHLISDIERVFDQVIFVKEGEIILHKDAEELRLERNKSIDEIFREEFKW
ncbi:MAG: ABC transporter ATP-binding protein [Erysipelotrichaceae bacterium]|nr:ABC transporter ATP-binding protein [Erysipelotrichaceae bacterium]